jgi:hypothetical protein
MPFNLRPPWNSQPQYAAPINWANPLTNGLVRLVVFNQGKARDLVTRSELTQVSTGFSNAYTPKGKGQTNTNETSYWTLPVRTEGATFFSCGWLGSQNGGTSTVVLRDASSSGGSIVLWRNSSQWDLRLGGIDYTQAGTFSASTNYCAVVTANASTGKLFVDGNQVISGSNVGAAGSFNSPWYLHQNGTAAQGGSSTSLLLAIWDRPLTDTEARSFSTNPWQLFQPPRWRRLFVPPVAGVQFDAAATSGYQAASTSISWSHTVGSQANRCLIVQLAILGTGSASAVTYNGVAMTKQTNASDGIPGIPFIETWYLAAPASGTNTVAVTLSGSLAAVGDSLSYYNVDQSAPIEAGTVNGASGSPASVSLTTIAANSRVVGHLAKLATGTVTSDAGQTSRASSSGASGAGFSDDKGPIASPGSTTLQWTGLGPGDNWITSSVSLQVPRTQTFFARWFYDLVGQSRMGS